MRQLALLAVLIATPASAHEDGHWRALAASEISYALNERIYVYEGGETQRFYASGRTLYNAGQDSWGYWAVRGDQYCSQWPPADGWSCYDMDGDEESGAIRFIAPDGSYSVGYPR